MINTESQRRIAISSTVLGSTGLYWEVLDCTELNWAVLSFVKEHFESIALGTNNDAKNTQTHFFYRTKKTKADPVTMQLNIQN